MTTLRSAHLAVVTLISAALLLAPVQAVWAVLLKGDVNGNGQIDLGDAL
ncbi:MAG: hypothetical protein ACUVTZ_03755 [Armatimonadota bacterium]